MRERVSLNKKEQRRLMVLNEVLGGKLKAGQAAELLELSERQVRRILAAYRKEGAAALAHGNRGRQPVHTVSAEVRQQVVALATTKYQGFNHLHLSEKLEGEGIKLSRSAVRRILGAAGVPSPRKRRPARHRRRRERYPQEGMLLQIDGSRHDWLEGRGPYLTLIACIDDATGKVLAARFREQEDAHGYFLVLRDIVTTQGRPLAVYRDRHGIFERSEREPATIAEQLAGTREPTQFGRLLKELDIASIPAHSPQAKGRIERLFGTFQDRLVSELRLAGATTLEQANPVLANFLPQFNIRFAVEPAEPGLAYRPWPDDLKLQEVFAFKYVRTAGADNIVRLGEHRLQLLPTNGRQSYARVRVEVHERLDGSLAVYYQGHRVKTTEAPKEAPILRARSGRAPATPPTTTQEVAQPSAIKTTGQAPRSAPPKPRPDHPWRVLAKAAAAHKNAQAETQEGGTPAEAGAPPSRSLQPDSIT